MKYRDEVERALPGGNPGSLPPTAVELITLGVKLGLEWAASTADEFAEVPHVAAAIRDIHPGYVLQVKP